jgi:hypothetical protein
MHRGSRSHAVKRAQGTNQNLDQSLPPESRTDPNIRFPGIANWDFTLFKKTKLSERFGLEFRAEVFNMFNRVQFGPPGNAQGAATFGVISSQYNNPRLGLRLKLYTTMKMAICAAWFSTFLEKPLVSRVNRRLDILTVRLWRSM